MPVWVWLLVVVIGIGNEIVNRAKWTAAQSIFQGIGAFLLWVPVLGPVLAKFPVLGALLLRMAAKDPEAGKMPLPTGTPPTVMLPFFMLFALTACGAAGRAWLRCELNALPQTSQGAISCVTGALGSQGDWQSVLIGCGTSLLPSQLNCVVAAIAAAGGDKVSVDGAKSPIVERAQIWLNAHGGVPKACAESTRL
jgi:hypothetical protein